jgi:hypothetical protein
MMKKEYTSPQLKVHGDVEKITLQGQGKTCPKPFDSFDLAGKSECFTS